MENKQNDYALFLTMLNSPAFIVQNGKVTYVNSQADQMAIIPGDPIAPMLKDDPNILETMEETSISFTLTVEIFRCAATITKLSDGFLFTVTDHVSDEVKALFLVLQQLYPSFARIEATVSDHPEVIPSNIRREFYRIKRIFMNIKNARRYSFKDAHFLQVRDFCSVIDCTLEECAEVLKEAGIELKYKIPKEPIEGMCDNLMLEQAVYNLICNAVQYSDKGEPVEVELTRNGGFVQLTVTSHSKELSPAVRANMFSCYAHELGMADGVHGLGLGMLIVQKVAIVHGGTVLVRQNGKSTQVCMTMEIRPNTNDRLCAPGVSVIGPQDDAFVMLSDALPNTIYETDRRSR